MKTQQAKTQPKRLRIVVGTNSLANTQYEAYTNHIQFWFRLGRVYPDIDFIICNPARMSIDRMRNMASEVAMQHESDYLLFMDDDVIVPLDALGKLLALDADIAAAPVVIRGYPFHFMTFSKYKGGCRPDATLPRKGIVDRVAVGFSFCLIKTSILIATPTPHFVTGISNTEDVYFCIKAAFVKKDLTVKVDCSIDAGHILWPEVMSANNRLAYKRYFETMNPQVRVKRENAVGDRGAKYLKEVKSALEKTEPAA